MTRDAIARRYAGTLYELASERDEVDAVLATLDRFRAVAAATPELMRALSGALLSPDEKKRLVADGLPGAPRLLLDFYGLVIDKRRAAHAVAMAEAFRSLVERERNIIDVEVRSAVALTDDEQASLRRRLEAVTGATVRLDGEVEPAVLGGLVIQIGDRRIDLSLRARLQRLRQQLTGR